MAHMIICGQTESGKTMLARALAEKYLAAGKRVIVLDSAYNTWPDKSVHVESMSDFLDICARSRNCALFIDEAGDELGTYQKTGNIVATKMRHLGHFAHFIAQEAKAINPTVRRQCSKLTIFNVWRESADILAQAFNKPEIKQAADLPQFHYLFVERFGQVSRGDVREYYKSIGNWRT